MSQKKIEGALPLLILPLLILDDRIFLLACIAVFVYLMIRNNNAVMLIPLLLIFTESNPIALPGLDLTLSKWGFAFLLLIYLRKRPKFSFSPVFIPISVFLGGFLLWTAVAADAVILRWTVTMTANILFFFLVFQLLKDKQMQKQIVRGLLFALVINASLGIFQFISGGRTLLYFGMNNEKMCFEHWGDFVRSSGLFQNTNLFVSFLIPLCLILFPLIKKKHRYLFIPVIFGVLFTFSRGAWVAVIAALMIFLLRRGKKYFPLLIPIILLILFTPFGQRFYRKAQDHSVYYSDMGRKASFEVGAEFISRNIYTGIGPGKFYTEFARYAPDNLPWSNFYPHNAFIAALGETGITGFFSLLAIFYILLAALAKEKRRPGLHWMMGSIFSLFILSNFYDLHTEPQFWIIVAIAAGIQHFEPGRKISVFPL